MKTIVDLADEPVRALSHLSEQTQLSCAELVRRAVAEFLDQHQAQTV
ncbi:MAG: ribbon-helix-helix protein, CopG family [Oleiphilaceae bacterium]|nr:ribbon-helix-helix protein, CopG family [Oleiphilaceae bacterium]